MKKEGWRVKGRDTRGYERKEEGKQRETEKDVEGKSTGD